MTQLLLSIVAAYLLGAIPFSLWAGKLFGGVDLRKVGSKNLGATNTFRILGAKVALPVLFLDTGKGFLSARFLPGVFGTASLVPEHLSLICGISSIIGHTFSVFAGFRGGKGVATSLGVFLAIVPTAALFSFLVWLAAFLTSGYVSLASCVAALVFPFSVHFVSGGSLSVLLVSTVVSVFVILKHIPNIKRLIKGEEKKLLGKKSNREEGAP